MSAPLVIPAGEWTAVTDDAQIAEVVALANCAIASTLDDDALQVCALTRHDDDAPAGLSAPAPGMRHLQIELHNDEARTLFLLALFGRPGSELLGYTPDELTEGAKLARGAISDLMEKGHMTAEVRNNLETLVAMLRAPHTVPSRMQSIEVADVVSIHVCAEIFPKGAAHAQ